MGVVIKFFVWLYERLRSAVAFLVSVGGMIVSAVAGCIAVVSSMFSRFSFWDSPRQWLQDATTAVADVVNNDVGVIGGVLLRFFAVDRLVQVCATSVASTVGVTVLIFVTIFTALVSVVPAVLAVRAVLRAVKLSTGGVIDP